MAELKTKPTDKKVTDFLDSVEHPKKKEDSYKVLELMKKVTGEEPVMWGNSIIGFGTYTYKYASVGKATGCSLVSPRANKP